MISLSPEAQRELAYARREAPKRGGYIWEGARTAMGGLLPASSSYSGDQVLGELLAAGLLVPHEDPTKGRVPVPASKPDHRRPDSQTKGRITPAR